MKAYTIFDDFPQQSLELLQKRGIDVVVHPKGMPRPQGNELKALLDEYDILFVSTAQQMPEDMFVDVVTPKVVATASSGVDHIHVPASKANLVRIANAPKANRNTVAEHTFALILALRKQLLEARDVAAEGKNKKAMHGKFHDLYGATMGVVGAGGIATKVLDLARCFGMHCLCWTFHPDHHQELLQKGVEFIDLDTLCRLSDVISVNIPSTSQTHCLINRDRVSLMKEDALLITTSRADVTDIPALIEKAHTNDKFGLGMDVDSQIVVGQWKIEERNIFVTPHIGGGTVESRIRLFNECCENALALI